MKKVDIDDFALFTMPVTLVGTRDEKGRENFMTAAWVTRANKTPPMVAVVINNAHHTNKLIRANGVFSINIAPAALVEEADYCGIVSGRKYDKSKVFDIFYGENEKTPLIKDCPVCIECELDGVYEMPSNTIFIGKVTAAWADDGCIKNGKPDYAAINPLLLTMPDNIYRTLGGGIGRAWHDGKKLKREE